MQFHSHGRICTEAPDVVRLPPEALVALRAAIARSGFATAAENCCNNCVIFDAETVALTVADGAGPKTIIDKECPEAPTTVRDLAQTIEIVIGIERWIGPDPDEEPSWCG